MVDIIDELVNRIRLSNNELISLYNILKKIDSYKLSVSDEEFYNILIIRIKARLERLNEK